ncbi:MAG: hypothetical protein ABWX85_01495 [Arthrobacter sp.]
MGDFIAYLDTSEVRPGKLEELKAAMSELAQFVELNEPRIMHDLHAGFARLDGG